MDPFPNTVVETGTMELRKAKEGTHARSHGA